MALALGTANEAAEAFARLLGPLPLAPGPGALVGLEHEYSLSVNGRRVDFRKIIHHRPIAGRRIDPGDTNAYRCLSGVLLTCDDAEAEIATPPISVRTGFAAEALAWAELGQAELAGILPEGVTPEGVSTHLSAAMPAELNDAACHLYAKTFAPSLMMFLDRADSFGIDIRPRVGRLEINGEYVTGERLQLLAAFYIGTARACADALRGDPEARELLPPPVRLQIRRCEERYGVRVVRDSSGTNLYEEGRRALLTTIAGETITAQEHLELAWHASRRALGGLISGAEEAAIDAVVAGSAPLGIEESDAGAEGGPVAPVSVAGLTSPYGRVLERLSSSRIDVRARLLTWDWGVFEITGLERPVYASMPSAAFEPFAAAVERGDLDTVVGEYAHGAAPTRALRRNEDTRTAGLWDGVPLPSALLPEEYGLEQYDEGAQARAAAVSPIYKRYLARTTSNGAPTTVTPAPHGPVAVAAPRPALALSAARPYKYTRTGNGGGIVDDGGGWNLWLLLIPGIIAIIVIALTTFFLLNRGSGEHGAVVLPTDTVVVVETPPVTEPPSETARPVLSGTYVTEITVDEDPAGHEPFVDMPDQLQLDVLITRDTATGAITIVITGPAPWVTLQGFAQFGPDFTSNGGAFTAAGAGTVAGYADVAVEFTGTVTADGGLQGVLTMGTNGALPTGQAISYAVVGGRS